MDQVRPQPIPWPKPRERRLVGLSSSHPIRWRPCADPVQKRDPGDRMTQKGIDQSRPVTEGWVELLRYPSSALPFGTVYDGYREDAPPILHWPFHGIDVPGGERCEHQSCCCVRRLVGWCGSHLAGARSKGSSCDRASDATLRRQQQNLRRLDRRMPLMSARHRQHGELLEHRDRVPARRNHLHVQRDTGERTAQVTRRSRRGGSPSQSDLDLAVGP